MGNFSRTFNSLFEIPRVEAYGPMAFIELWPFNSLFEIRGMAGILVLVSGLSAFNSLFEITRRSFTSNSTRGGENFQFSF